MLIPIATTESWVQKKDTSLQKVIRVLKQLVLATYVRQS